MAASGIAFAASNVISMKLLTVAAMAFTLLAGSVNAAEQLNAYSIMPEKYASKVFAEFTKTQASKLTSCVSPPAKLWPV